MPSTIKILGVAASLRSNNFDFNLANMPDTRNDLDRFLMGYAQHYTSNSELSLLAALWGAQQEDAVVDIIKLWDYLNTDNDNRRKSMLLSLLKETDGIIISSPVYFGASSSLCQRLIEMLNSDPTMKKAFSGKIYAGLAVGAKRNGGQETTLIYQMADMLNLGTLGVGNDTTTTSQYGGTGVAGNTGAMVKDRLGLETCIGTGRRIAQIAGMYARGVERKIEQNISIDFWIFQDQNQIAETLLKPLQRVLINKNIQTSCYHIYDYNFQACKACNRCPNQPDHYRGYRCGINSPYDELKILHDHLVSTDVIVPTFFIQKVKDKSYSVYQHFLERTRYLRRGDYALSNRIILPLIFYRDGQHDHLELRLISSLIRHNTILHKPVFGTIDQGRLVNADRVFADWTDAVQTSVQMVVGRYQMESEFKTPQYIPIGY